MLLPWLLCTQIFQMLAPLRYFYYHGFLFPDCCLLFMWILGFHGFLFKVILSYLFFKIMIRIFKCTFYINILIFGCAGSSFPRRLFTSRGERGLLCLCGGFFCCGTQALGAWGSVVRAQALTGSGVVMHRLSCSTACGIFLDQGLNHVFCIGWWTLYHWATGKPHGFLFY